MLRWPVEPMRAAGATALPPPRRGVKLVYEMKFDGFRLVAWNLPGGVRLQSRHGTDLTHAFPDIAAAVAEHLPPGVVLDGEVLVWDEQRGRTSFTRLQRRLTAGRRIAQVAAAAPAHFVAFDLLRDADGRELLTQPLTARRAALEQLLAAAPQQLPICPQTSDRELAQSWFAEFGVAGVEGLVIKKPGARYEPGKLGWLKIRARDTADFVVGGVTGSLDLPNSLLLGRYDRGVLRFVGQTHPLKPAQRRGVAAALQPMVFQGDGAGHPWPCPLPPGWAADFTDRQPIPYARVEPTLVIEVETDTAIDGPYGRLRHRCWPTRLRLDLRPSDVEGSASSTRLSNSVPRRGGPEV